MASIDINCDMGESTHLWHYDINNDMALLPYLSAVNIACGAHAGDAHTMHQLVDEALQRGIAIGAHPGFEDRENFGRTNQQISPEKIYDLIIYQLGALNAFLKINGTKLRHVKPHGALYNMAAKDAALAYTICRAVKEYDEALVLYGLSGSELINSANAIGLKTCSEVFADRSYQDDGSLTPRTQSNAMIKDEEQSLQQVLQMAMHGTVTCVTGKTINVQADTICIHSDGKHALAFAQRIYQTLNQKGIEIRPA
ncbi:MAG: 5-oxoprolinase subunit PxpA [Chitinophagaceae bacterium]